MKQVIFYDYTTGRQEIVGKVLFDDKTIIFEDLPKKLEEEMIEGILDRKTEKKVLPSDGLKFLRALPLYYRGSMLTASLVQEL